MLLMNDERDLAIAEVHEATSIYTTASVVDDLLKHVGWPNGRARLVDPSAGDGAFLVGALEMLKPEPGDFVAVGRVKGYELYCGAVAQARRRVAATLEGMGWSADDAALAADAMVEERDFLTSPEVLAESFDVISGNPPFLRLARVPDYFKKLYGQHVARYAMGDLLHAFLDRCSCVLKPGGSICLVTSDRWLFSATASQLREQIGSKVSLGHVQRLSVETSFYRPKVRRAGSLPRVHPVAVVLHGVGVGGSPITDAPISPDGALGDVWDGPRLGEVATLRLAPWLGPHGIFTIDISAAAAFSGSTGIELVPVVDTDDAHPRTNVLSPPTRLAIRTQRGVEPTGAVSEHLLAGRERMPARGRRGPYWVPPESLGPDSDEETLMIPRIARSVRLIELPPGVAACNHNITLVRKGEAVSLEDIRKSLESPRTQAWIEANAPRLENGFYSITTTLLRRLPFWGEV